MQFHMNGIRAGDQNVLDASVLDVAAGLPHMPAIDSHRRADPILWWFYVEYTSRTGSLI
jgi:hypothetical protein